MSFATLTLDQMNYQLRMGYRDAAEAQRYCDLWNRTKVSTEAHVALCHTRGIAVPVIRVRDLP